MTDINLTVKSGKCVGCGNCKIICPVHAISFTTINGFKYPVIDSNTCVSCGKCYKLCPISEEKTLSSPISFYAAFAKDEMMPAESTSGGICTLLSEVIINTGGVVFSVRFTDEWTAEYSRVDSIEDLQKHIGSKYMQADSNDVQIKIVEELKKEKEVLVIGTPCFISAINKYIGYLNVDRSKLITVDFLCHGVPSPEIASAFIKSLDNRKKKLVSYNFRSKKSGWGKHERSTRYEGEVEKSIRSDFCPLQTWFGHHLSLRESCFNCDYRSVEKTSDITVADFWKIEKYYPELPFKQGVSAVQTNTINGENTFRRLITSECIVSKEVSQESIWEHRKTAIRNFDKPKQYDLFWDTWNKEGLSGIMKDFPSQNTWTLIKAKIKSLCKKVGGS